MSLTASYETQKDDKLFEVIYRGVFALSANHPEHLVNITLKSSDDQTSLGICAQSQHFHRGKIGELFLRVETRGREFPPEFVRESIMRYGGRVINCLKFKGDFNFRYCAPDGAWDQTLSRGSPEEKLKEAELLDILGIPYRIEKGRILVEDTLQNTSELKNQADAFLWGTNQGLDTYLVSCVGGDHLTLQEKYISNNMKKLTWSFQKTSVPIIWGLLGGLDRKYLGGLDQLMEALGVKFGGRIWDVTESNAVGADGRATFVIAPNLT